MASKALGISPNQTDCNLHSADKSKSIYNSRKLRLERIRKSAVMGKVARTSAKNQYDRRTPDTYPKRAVYLENWSHERLQKVAASTYAPTDDSPLSPGGVKVPLGNESQNQLTSPKAVDCSSGNHNPRSPVSVIEFDPSLMHDELYLHQLDAPKVKKTSKEKDSQMKKYVAASRPSVAAFDPSVPYDEQLEEVLKPQKPEKSHGSRSDENRLSELKFDLTALSVHDPDSTAPTDDESDLDSLTYSMASK